jgi:nucleotide-binding universal stress UspA family protein
MKIRVVLCPTDFSEFSRRALEHATAVAKWNEAELTVLHVYPFMVPLAADMAYIPSGLPLDANGRANLLDELEAAAAPARAAGLKPKLLLLEGDPVEVILRQARAMAADLIVTGTHGRRGFERWILGSVAHRLAHKAPCAVLTVPRPPEGARSTAEPQYERILCPLELSGPEPAVDAASSFARACGARLTLLHVLEDLPQREVAVGVAHVAWAAFRDDLEQDARQRLSRAVAVQPAEGFQVDQVVAAGKPYREILKLADTIEASLIVMGTHGRSALERPFVGSTTLHVLRQARCPVLTVREPGQARRP